MAAAAASPTQQPPAVLFFLVSTMALFRATLFRFVLLVHKFYSIVYSVHILLILVYSTSSNRLVFLILTLPF
jgi:hypothetical protein